MAVAGRRAVVGTKVPFLEAALLTGAPRSTSRHHRPCLCCARTTRTNPTKCHVRERSGLLSGTDVTPDRRGQRPHARKDRAARCQNAPQTGQGAPCTCIFNTCPHFLGTQAAFSFFSAPRTLGHASQGRRQGAVGECSRQKAGNGVRRGGTGAPHAGLWLLYLTRAALTTRRAARTRRFQLRKQQLSGR